MRSLIRWAVDNSPAMNTLMVATLIVGAISLLAMRREVFPEFDLEIILVSVSYPGASPAEVEEGICQKLEEAVGSISGIKKQTSIAQEGGGHLVLELEAGIRDVQRVVNEVRSEIDQIPSLPLLAEDPEVQQLTIREAAIRLAVVGPRSRAPPVAESLRNSHLRLSETDELQLREVAERVRDDLLLLPTVSQVNLIGARDYQIDVEIPEQTLRDYGLSLQQVAAIIRRQNIELPSGTMKTPSQEVLLRGMNKRLVGEEIAQLPLVTHPDGVVLTVGDLARVRDEFTDETAINQVDGRPAVVISVDRTATEDLLRIVEEVKQYVAGAAEQGRIPPGYELKTWADRSVDVRDRMNMLGKNGLQGLVLVFLVLAIFLDLRLAFWVALGIPIAVLGSAAVLFYGGQTLNMLSMFAFLMALGIVVDDAIVIGENIYTHRQRGKSFVQAAVDGTCEVLPSVLASVSTTIIAFIPLLFVAGVMGKFIAVLPVTVIAMLVFSLLESAFILPCHLGHRKNLFLTIAGYLLLPFRVVADVLVFLNRQVSRGLAWVIQRLYDPSLEWAMRHPAVTIATALAVLLLTWGIVRSGTTPYIFFPKLDSNWIQARVTYPDGTPAHVTDEATQRLEAALMEVSGELSLDPDQPLVHLRHRAVGQISGAGPQGPDSRISGSHVGGVDAELVDTSLREVHSEEILRRWREAAGSFPGAESVSFGTPQFGPGGPPVEFKLLAPTEDMAVLEEAVEEVKARLATYDGVFDVRDDSAPGKYEYQFTVKDSAKALGVTAADLAETVRAAYFGEEVMRLQRGRHEVKLMVRYPPEQRRSIADFEEIRHRGEDGVGRPLPELADVRVTRGYSEINRIDRLRSITVTADVDEGITSGTTVTAQLKRTVIPELLERYPGIRVRWEGQQEQYSESIQSMLLGYSIALLAMFVLLTFEFRSYFQPLLVMAIIPFASIGAIWGHALMGLPLTIFTMFGFIALTGVVVNDSIVLIDFINRRARGGTTVMDALKEAGRRRFRPVLLTSITTVAGLLPLLLETSFQAQILIPMAATLAFGLVVATPLILYLVPTVYGVYVRVIARRSLDDTLDDPNAADVFPEATDRPPHGTSPLAD